jgi:hypothetical protein
LVVNGADEQHMRGFSIVVPTHGRVLMVERLLSSFVTA